MKLAKYAAILAVAGSISATTFAEEAITGYAGASVTTAYLSRGKLLTDDAAFQPYAGICFYGFDLNLWAHNDLAKDEENSMEEIDYELSYSGSVDSFNYKLAGVIWAYDNCDNDYRAYVNFSYSNDYITPSLYAIYQIKNSDGTDGGVYGSFKLSKDIALDDDLSLSISALVGYADEDYRVSNWGVEDCGLVDCQADVSLSYAVTEQLSLTAGCTFNAIIDDDIKDVEETKQADEKSEHVIGYLGACVSF